MYSQTFIYFFHLHLHLPIFASPLPAPGSKINSLENNFIYQFRCVSHYIISNCIRIDRQYSPHPVPMSFWLLQAPNYHPSTLDTLHTLLIGHTTFPSFSHPTFQQWHWSPHKVDINNSLIHGSRFRKEVISYWFIVSKSLIIMPDFSINLYQCILFYYI